MSGSWIAVEPPQSLSDWERAAVKRLAPSAEPAAINALKVVDRCQCGCSSIGFSPGEHFAVAKAEAADSDGIPIWVMLFADRDERRLATLDVLRADSEPIKALPPVSELRVTETSRWTGAVDP